MSIEKFKDFRIFHFETRYFCYSCHFCTESYLLDTKLVTDHLFGKMAGWKYLQFDKTTGEFKRRFTTKRRPVVEKKTAKKKNKPKKISLTKPLQTRATLTAIQTNRGKKHPQYKNYKIPSRQLILLTHTILKACKMNPLDPRHLHARNYLPLFDSTRFKTKTKNEKKKNKIKC